MKYKKIIFAILLITLAVIVCFSLQNPRSALIKSIDNYERTTAADSKDFTPVIDGMLQTGMTIDEVVQYFKKMGFDVWEPHASNQKSPEIYKLTANYSKGWLVVKRYIVLLEFKDNKLHAYKGKIVFESP